MSTYAALAVRIRENLNELEQVVDRAIQLSEKAITTGDDGYWDGVALNLHGFYSGVERIFEDIARTLEGSIPSGSDWHRSLLVQMMAGVPEIRPSVITRETRYCLDEYRGFRHVVRSAYAFKFRPARLRELAAGLRKCHGSIHEDLSSFIKFLENL